MSDYGTLRRHVGALPFELAMAVGLIATSVQGNWKHAAASLFTLSVSFLPLLIERWGKIKLPAFLKCYICMAEFGYWTMYYILSQDCLLALW
jgi:hypothetical protein